jgi:ubiquinone/menaquinone biosynthesis C-methylase UbiE
MPSSTPDETLATYYAQRAAEYEKIYFRDDPQRQKEQSEIQSQIREVLLGLEIFEVACGTGYWTQFASETADRIVATDINDEVLEIAKQKNYSCPVLFENADAYSLPFEPNSFTGGLANFWFSHVPKNRIDEFLTGFHKLLKPGSPVFICDNVFVEGIGGELIRKEGDEDTYKLRTLKNGTRQEILKNYFSRKELFEIFQNYDHSFSEKNIVIGKCFWAVKYTA